MRAAVKQNTNEVVIKEVLIPVPRDGEVLVKINAVGVCASDLHLVREAFAYLRMAPGVDIVGHEGCGTVAARKPDFHLAVQAQYNGWVIRYVITQSERVAGASQLATELPSSGSLTFARSASCAKQATRTSAIIAAYLERISTAASQSMLSQTRITSFAYRMAWMTSQ